MSQFFGLQFAALKEVLLQCTAEIHVVYFSRLTQVPAHVRFTVHRLSRKHVPNRLTLLCHLALVMDVDFL